MISLHFIDPVALARSGEAGGDIAEATRTLARHNLHPGTPFLLGDDGAPLRVINRWLAGLEADGTKPNTWAAYAYDLLDWVRFLDRRNTPVLEATHDDVGAYHAERRRGTRGLERVVSAATWNRKVATLDGFYSWATRSELIASRPFRFKDAVHHGPGGGRFSVRRNHSKERTGRDHATLKWLEPEQLDLFLNVGIGGLTAAGAADVRYRGRCFARNAAMARFLVGCGARIEEASHLLIFELPPVPTRPREFVRMSLPGEVCKGGVGRHTLVPTDALRAVHAYVRTERLLAPAPPFAADALVVTEADAAGGVVAGKRTSWARISTLDRRRLIDPEGRPLVWALTERGHPMVRWTEVFRRASQRARCVDAGFPSVSPHTMRHTFAVTMLRELVRRTATQIRERVGDADPALWAPFWRMHDPLLTLRDLLGHASITTTQKYLHAIDPTRLYASEAPEDDDDD